MGPGKLRRRKSEWPDVEFALDKLRRGYAIDHFCTFLRDDVILEARDKNLILNFFNHSYNTDELRVPALAHMHAFEESTHIILLGPEFFFKAGLRARHAIIFDETRRERRSILVVRLGFHPMKEISIDASHFGRLVEIMASPGLSEVANHPPGLHGFTVTRSLMTEEFILFLQETTARVPGLDQGLYLDSDMGAALIDWFRDTREERARMHLNTAFANKFMRAASQFACRTARGCCTRCVPINRVPYFREHDLPTLRDVRVFMARHPCINNPRAMTEVISRYLQHQDDFNFVGRLNLAPFITATTAHVMHRIQDEVRDDILSAVGIE